MDPGETPPNDGPATERAHRVSNVLGSLDLVLACFFLGPGACLGLITVGARQDAAALSGSLVVLAASLCVGRGGYLLIPGNPRRDPPPACGFRWIWAGLVLMVSPSVTLVVIDALRGGMGTTNSSDFAAYWVLAATLAAVHGFAQILYGRHLRGKAPEPISPAP